MRKILLVGLSIWLFSCGSSSGPSTYSGTWDGTLTARDTTCPFSVATNLNGAFPMVIDESADSKTITVTAHDGSIAVGGKGVGEEIGFQANATQFGDFGSLLPYTCTSIATLDYLGTSDTEADTGVVISFTNCVTPTDPTNIFSCATTYAGKAVKR